MRDFGSETSNRVLPLYKKAMNVIFNAFLEFIANNLYSWMNKLQQRLAPKVQPIA
jgi:hypothetical protein